MAHTPRDVAARGGASGEGSAPGGAEQHEPHRAQIYDLILTDPRRAFVELTQSETLGYYGGRDPRYAEELRPGPEFEDYRIQLRGLINSSQLTPPQKREQILELVAETVQFHHWGELTRAEQAALESKAKRERQTAVEGADVRQLETRVRRELGKAKVAIEKVSLLLNKSIPDMIVDLRAQGIDDVEIVARTVGELRALAARADEAVARFAKPTMRVNLNVERQKLSWPQAIAQALERRKKRKKAAEFGLELAQMRYLDTIATLYLQADLTRAQYEVIKFLFDHQVPQTKLLQQETFESNALDVAPVKDYLQDHGIVDFERFINALPRRGELNNLRKAQSLFVRYVKGGGYPGDAKELTDILIGFYASPGEPSDFIAAGKAIDKLGGRLVEFGRGLPDASLFTKDAKGLLEVPEEAEETEAAGGAPEIKLSAVQQEHLRRLAQLSHRGDAVGVCRHLFEHLDLTWLLFLTKENLKLAGADQAVEKVKAYLTEQGVDLQQFIDMLPTAAERKAVADAKHLLRVHPGAENAALVDRLVEYFTMPRQGEAAVDARRPLVQYLASHRKNLDDALYRHVIKAAGLDPRDIAREAFRRTPEPATHPETAVDPGQKKLELTSEVLAARTLRQVSTTGEVLVSSGERPLLHIGDKVDLVVPIGQERYDQTALADAIDKNGDDFYAHVEGHIKGFVRENGEYFVVVVDRKHQTGGQPAEWVYRAFAFNYLLSNDALHRSRFEAATAERLPAPTGEITIVRNVAKLSLAQKEAIVNQYLSLANEPYAAHMKENAAWYKREAMMQNLDAVIQNVTDQFPDQFAAGDLSKIISQADREKAWQEILARFTGGAEEPRKEIAKQLRGIEGLESSHIVTDLKIEEGPGGRAGVITLQTPEGVVTVPVFQNRVVYELKDERSGENKRIRQYSPDRLADFTGVVLLADASRPKGFVIQRVEDSCLLSPPIEGVPPELAVDYSLLKQNPDGTFDGNLVLADQRVVSVHSNAADVPDALLAQPVRSRTDKEIFFITIDYTAPQESRYVEFMRILARDLLGTADKLERLADTAIEQIDAHFFKNAGPDFKSLKTITDRGKRLEALRKILEHFYIPGPTPGGEGAGPGGAAPPRVVIEGRAPTAGRAAAPGFAQAPTGYMPAVSPEGAPTDEDLARGRTAAAMPAVTEAKTTPATARAAEPARPARAGEITPVRLATPRTAEITAAARAAAAVEKLKTELAARVAAAETAKAKGIEALAKPPAGRLEAARTSLRGEIATLKAGQAAATSQPAVETPLSARPPVPETAPIPKTAFFHAEPTAAQKAAADVLRARLAAALAPRAPEARPTQTVEATAVPAPTRAVEEEPAAEEEAAAAVPTPAAISEALAAPAPSPAAEAHVADAVPAIDISDFAARAEADRLRDDISAGRAADLSGFERLWGASGLNRVEGRVMLRALVDAALQSDRLSVVEDLVKISAGESGLDRGLATLIPELARDSAVPAETLVGLSFSISDLRLRSKAVYSLLETLATTKPELVQNCLELVDDPAERNRLERTVVPLLERRAQAAELERFRALQERAAVRPSAAVAGPAEFEISESGAPDEEDWTAGLAERAGQTEEVTPAEGLITEEMPAEVYDATAALAGNPRKRAALDRLAEAVEFLTAEEFRQYILQQELPIVSRGHPMPDRTGEVYLDHRLRQQGKTLAGVLADAPSYGEWNAAASDPAELKRLEDLFAQRKAGR